MLKATAAQTQPLKGTCIIQFANDHLTVKVIDMPLTELLQEIARQALGQGLSNTAMIAQSLKGQKSFDYQNKSIIKSN